MVISRIIALVYDPVKPGCFNSQMNIYLDDFQLLKTVFILVRFFPNKLSKQGFWYFAEKKEKFRTIFRGKFAKKFADFAGFSQEKTQNSRKNRPISRDSQEKVKICRKIGRFHGILAEKSQILKDFQGQVLRKIGRFHGKFWGKTSPRNNQ